MKKFFAFIPVVAVAVLLVLLPYTLYGHLVTLKLVTDCDEQGVADGVDVNLIRCSSVLAAKLPANVDDQMVIQFDNLKRYNNNRAALKTMFDVLKVVYKENSAWFTTLDTVAEHEQDIKKNVLDRLIDRHPEGIVYPNGKKQGAEQRYVARQVNPSDARKVLFLAYDLQFHNAIKRAFAAYYAVALFTSLRAMKLGEDEAQFMAFADIDLVPATDKTAFLQLDSMVRNEVKQEYYDLFGRWFDGQALSIGADKVPNIVAWLMRLGRIPPHDLVAPTLQDLSKFYVSEIEYLMTWSARQLPNLLGGRSACWYDCKWVLALPLILQKEMTKLWIVRHDVPLNNALRNSFDLNDLRDLASYRKIPKVSEQFLFISLPKVQNLRDLAQYYAHYYTREQNYLCWGIFDDAYKTSAWVSFLPDQVQTYLAYFCRGVLLKHGVDRWLNDKQVEIPAWCVPGLIELGVVPLPPAFPDQEVQERHLWRKQKIEAFKRLDERTQVARFAYALEVIEQSKIDVLSSKQKKQYFVTLMQRLPQSFGHNVWVTYAIRTNFKGMFVSPALTVSLHELIENGLLENKAFADSLMRDHKLDLSGKHVQAITVEALSVLLARVQNPGSIEELDLSHNPLKKDFLGLAPADTIKLLPGIKRLNLSYTGITAVVPSIQEALQKDVNVAATCTQSEDDDCLRGDELDEVTASAG
jgi:hypothetical protein